jgi:hypothetical protein
VLTRSVDDESVWLPVKRIDSEEEARAWQERDKRTRRIQEEADRVKKK